jgi:hypothetical protein
MIQCLQKLAVVVTNNATYLAIFWRNTLTITTSVPGVVPPLFAIGSTAFRRTTFCQTTFHRTPVRQILKKPSLSNPSSSNSRTSNLTGA